MLKKLIIGLPMQDLDDTDGDGFVGFVHQVVIDQYLTKHEELLKILNYISVVLQ